MTLVQMENVSKYYYLGEEVGIKALDGITLSIEKGEFVAIMGPSGSGKSTLMNILGCLDVPDEGVYTLDGKEIQTLTDNQLAEIRNKQIGFIFQNFNLLPRLSAFENVELPLTYQGLSKKDRRQLVLDTLAVMELQYRKEHLPSELSGGQQQRVAIARALAGNPQIILADEPTGSLDTKTGHEIMNIFKKLNDQGRTVIIITHDQSVANQAHRTIHIRDGKIVN